MAITKTSAKYVKGGKTLDYKIALNGTAVKSGDFKIVCGCNCLAIFPIAAGTTGTLKVIEKGEVVSVTTDEAIGSTNEGVAVYLDSNNLVTKVATNNTLLGYTAAAVGSSDLTFDIICA